MTPVAGEPLNIDAIDIPKWYDQNEKACTFWVTSSLDGFVNPLGTVTYTPATDVTSTTIPVTGLSGLTNAAGPITIQIDVASNFAWDTYGFSGRLGSSDSLEVLGSFGAQAVPVTWTGLDGSGGNGTWNTTNANSWKATTGGGAAPYADGVAVHFDSTGTNTNITVDAGGVAPGPIAFTNGLSTPYTFTGGAIGGSDLTTLTVNGAGSVTLNNSNTYTGGTIVNSGTLNASADGALGSGPVLVSGGILNANTDASLGTGVVTVNSGTLNFTSATPTISHLTGTGGKVVLSYTALTLGGDNITSSYAGSIGQAASTSGSITKNGWGTLTLSGSNSYTGGTTINGGTLLAINTAGSATGSGNVTIAYGATLGGSAPLLPPVVTA